MTVNLSPLAGAGQQFFTDTGSPLTGGKLYSYIAGTTTPQTSYTNSAGTVAHTNPIILNAAGRVATGEIWITSGVIYKFVLYTSTDVLIATWDNITGINGTGIATNAINVEYDPAGTGAVSTNVQAKLRQIVSVKDFGAVGDGVTNDLPAFQAAHDSFSASNSAVGGEIWIPTGSYYLAGTWVITKRVKITGTSKGDQVATAACKLTFPINVTAIRVHSSLSSPTGTGADYTVIQDVNISAVSTAGTVGHGIHMSTRCRLYRLSIRNFGGNGLHTVANSGTGTGNANLFYYEDVRVVDVKGHGFFTSEADANAGSMMLCDATSNDGWGFYEDSKLGNTYVACHASGNTLGSFINTGDGGSSNSSVFIGCYIESGATANTSFTGDKSIWLGGTNVPGDLPTVRANTGSLQLNTSPSKFHIFLRDGTEIGRIDATDKLTGFSGYSATSVSTTALTDITLGLITITGASTASQDRVRFNNPNGRVGEIVTSGSTTAYNTSSDYRLKTNIADMGSALNVVNQLRPVTYDWLVDGKFGSGFIAHELQEVLPQCVSGTKDEEEIENTYAENGDVISSKVVPNYQGIDVSFIIPYLVKAVQELQAKVDAL